MRKTTLLFLLLVSTFFHFHASLASEACPDDEKPVPINTPIDPCRLSGLKVLIASYGSEPGLGSGYLMAEIASSYGVQFWYKRFFAVLDDPGKGPEHEGKMLVTREFTVKDLKNWVPIFSKDGYNIILLRAVRINVKGGAVHARFYDNVVSGTFNDVEIKTGFNTKTNEPEMFIKNKIFNKLELIPNKLFRKAVGISRLHFEYFTQQVLTIDLD